MLPAPKSISPALIVSDPMPVTDVGTVAPRSLVNAICGALRTTAPPSLVKAPALEIDRVGEVDGDITRQKPMLL